MTPPLPCAHAASRRRNHRPAVRDVLVLAVGAVLGLGSALIVARTNARASRRLERDRWKRELYAEFLHLTDVMVGGSERGTGYEDAERLTARDRALRLKFELELLDEAMAEAAGEVWEPAKDYCEAQTGVADYEVDLDARLDQYFDAWSAFKEAARADLTL